MPELSIIVVTRGRSLLLARMLRSLGRAEEVDGVQLLVGLDGWEGREDVERAAARWVPGAETEVVELEKGTPAANRNALVARATGRSVVFLDDDVEVARGFVRAARRAVAQDGVVVAGGPNLTPPRSAAFEHVCGRVLASAVGAGPVRHRYRLGEAGEADERSLTLCNLVIRRDALGEAPFDPELRCAEENELLLRLARRGAAMVSSPDLVVWHHRRERMSLHGRQMTKYGFGRGQLLVRAFYAKQTTYAVPALALPVLAAGLAFAPMAALVVLCLYAAVIVAAGLRLGGLRRGPLATALIGCTHGAYALGIIAGVGYEANRLQRRVLRASEGRFGREAAAMLTALALAIAGGVATGVLVSRVFGPSGRGTFELARALSSIVAAIAGLGVGRAAVFLRPRGVVSDREIFGVVCAAALSATGIAALLGVVVEAGGWLSFRPLHLWLTCASIPPIAFYFQGQSALQGVARPAWFRRTLAVRDTFFFLMLLGALAVRPTLTLALAAWTAHWFLSAGTIALLLYTRCGPPRLPWGRWRQLSAIGSSQLLLGLLLGAHLRLDVVVLDLMRGPHDVGEYAVAVGVAEPITYGGIAIAMALYPRSAASSAQNAAGGAVRTARSLRAVLVLTAAAAAVVWAVGPWAIDLLFGPSFAAAGAPLRTLLPGVVGMTLFFVLQSDLAGRGRLWSVAASSVGATAMNVLFNLLLIPRFGVTGAALSSTLTYWVAAWLLLGVFTRTTGVPIRSCLVPRGRDARTVAAAFFGRRRDAMITS